MFVYTLQDIVGFGVLGIAIIYFLVIVLIEEFKR